MSFAHPWALVLFPAGVAILLLLQLYRERRRELYAGSLLLWKRVALQVSAPPRSLNLLDPPFLLQAAALLGIAFALAGPAWRGQTAPGRFVAILLDNGPAARATLPGGRRGWEFMEASAREVLDALQSDDRVALLVAAPVPRPLTPSAGVSPDEARSALKQVLPALSGPSPGEAARALLDAARTLGTNDAPPVALAFSLREAPADAGTAVHWTTLGPGGRLNNAALVAVGSERVPEPAADLDAGETEVLVQVRNFSTMAVVGSVAWRALDPEGAVSGSREVRLQASGQAGDAVGVAFRVPGESLPVLEVRWKNEAGPDALPEDDRLVLAPRPQSAPRVRIHGSAPAVELLFRAGAQAVLAELTDPNPVDLQVYVDQVPEQGAPDGARALLLIAPPAAFASFEVGAGTLKYPSVRVGDDDPLTRGFAAGGGGLALPVAAARELEAVANLKVLLQDAEGRPLAARFRLPGNRPGFVLAWAPGDELQKQSTHQAAATLLLRMLREAHGNQEPYAAARAAELERAAAAPLPLDEPAEFGLATGFGVLDIQASDLALGAPQAAAPDWAALLPVAAPRDLPLWPLGVLLALLAWVAELSLGRSRTREGVALGAVPANP